MAFRASPEEKTDLLVRIHHVCRSPLAGGGARAVMQAVAVAFRGLWKNTTGLTAEQVRLWLASDAFIGCLQLFLVCSIVCLCACPLLSVDPAIYNGSFSHQPSHLTSQAADRLAQNNTMHLLYGILVLLFILIAFQSWRKWLEVRERERFLLHLRACKQQVSELHTLSIQVPLPDCFCA